MLDEVVTIYAKYHGCSCPKDKVYGFRELVPQLVVDYRKTNLEVFLDVARLGSFEPEEHGGWYVSNCL